ncbi:MAG TPA: DUF2911 domain-containing protein [Flavobacteriales bacterium]|jgi:hypothetical protein|nr:DUF2911 domain-containing protein [Flavobacteriales bacterium]
MIVPKLPAHSPKSTLEQLIGITDVKVTYARPSVKGRTIFGDLVPFGQLWRTAANAGSYISFNTPVVLQGVAVPAGEYGLLTIPGKNSWRVMLNTSLRTILSVPYDPALNVLDVEVPVEKAAFTETFTIAFDDFRMDAAVLTITWEHTRIALLLEAPATEMGMAHVEEAMAQSDVTPIIMHSCASFCLDRNVRLAEALEWSRTSVEREPKFFSVRALSLLYAANGMKKEAIEAAKRSLELSRAAGVESFVKLNEAKIREWEGELVG